jgi:hypothetical protein
VPGNNQPEANTGDGQLWLGTITMMTMLIPLLLVSAFLLDSKGIILLTPPLLKAIHMKTPSNLTPPNTRKFSMNIN